MTKERLLRINDWHTNLTKLIRGQMTMHLFKFLMDTNVRQEIYIIDRLEAVITEQDIPAIVVKMMEMDESVIVY